MNRNLRAFLPAALLAVLVLVRPAAAQQVSGIDRTTADPAVRIQDDAYRAVEGRWLATERIPADRNAIGGFDALFEATQAQLRDLVDHIATQPDASAAADRRKIDDLYASFMDEARVESLGIEPLKPLLARIAAATTRADLPALIGLLDPLGVDTPFSVQVHQDAKDSTKYVVDLGQGGIGLPDRDYFLDASDQRFARVRRAYEAYLAKLLTLAGAEDAAAQAKVVVALEAQIAKVQWSGVANRDPVKTYNVFSMADLSTLAPHIDWTRWSATAGLTGRIDSLVVSQPTYLQGLDRLIASAPLATWKSYLTTSLLQAYAPYLTKAFVDTRFAFAGTTLQDTPANAPRWKRGIALVQGSLGESLGRMYVAKYFPPESKARMDRLVANLLAAYRVGLDGLDWMSPETKREAQAKLAALTAKIGYPVRWRDYAALRIERDDLVGDVQRSNLFESHRNLDKLGKPIDRDEWGITPQTINAYYNPELNEIVFPAAFLQKPFFDPAADDAVNYGAIGAIIGHEISHGFDDQGSQYDGRGNLRDWWTKEDRRRFDVKTKALVAQYAAYAPVKGYHVNGALTLGENIADNSGLAIAYRAYRLSLAGQDAPVIDGLTGDQRFYTGFVQAWQEKIRDAALVAQLKSDPHAPGAIRANGSLTNQPGFYAAFGVKPGDRMYVAPEKRVIIW